MVRRLYSDVVMGARRPGRNPSVTSMRFEGADKVVQSLLFLGPHAHKFKAVLFFLAHRTAAWSIFSVAS